MSCTSTTQHNGRSASDMRSLRCSRCRRRKFTSAVPTPAGPSARKATSGRTRSWRRSPRASPGGRSSSASIASGATADAATSRSCALGCVSAPIVAASSLRSCTIRRTSHRGSTTTSNTGPPAHAASMPCPRSPRAPASCEPTSVHRQPCERRTRARACSRSRVRWTSSRMRLVSTRSSCACAITPTPIRSPASRSPPRSCARCMRKERGASVGQRAHRSRGR